MGLHNIPAMGDKVITQQESNDLHNLVELDIQPYVGKGQFGTIVVKNKDAIITDNTGIRMIIVIHNGRVTETIDYARKLGGKINTNRETHIDLKPSIKRNGTWTVAVLFADYDKLMGAPTYSMQQVDMIEYQPSMVRCIVKNNPNPTYDDIDGLSSLTFGIIDEHPKRISNVELQVRGSSAGTWTTHKVFNWKEKNAIQNITMERSKQYDYKRLITIDRLDKNPEYRLLINHFNDLQTTTTETFKALVKGTVKPGIIKGRIFENRFPDRTFMSSTWPTPFMSINAGDTAYVEKIELWYIPELTVSSKAGNTVAGTPALVASVSNLNDYKAFRFKVDKFTERKNRASDQMNGRYYAKIFRIGEKEHTTTEKFFFKTLLRYSSARRVPIPVTVGSTKVVNRDFATEVHDTFDLKKPKPNDQVINMKVYLKDKSSNAVRDIPDKHWTYDIKDSRIEVTTLPFIDHVTEQLMLEHSSRDIESYDPKTNFVTYKYTHNIKFELEVFSTESPTIASTAPFFYNPKIVLDSAGNPAPIYAQVDTYDVISGKPEITIDGRVSNFGSTDFQWNSLTHYMYPQFKINAQALARPAATTPSKHISFGLDYAKLPGTFTESIGYDIPYVDDMVNIKGMVPEFFTMDSSGKFNKIPYGKKDDGSIDTEKQFMKLKFGESIAVYVQDPNTSEFVSVGLHKYIADEYKLFGIATKAKTGNNPSRHIPTTIVQQYTDEIYKDKILIRDALKMFRHSSIRVDGISNLEGHTGVNVRDRNKISVKDRHYINSVRIPKDFLQTRMPNMKELTYTIVETKGVKSMMPIYASNKYEFPVAIDQPNTNAVGKWWALVEYADSQYMAKTPVLEIDIDFYGKFTPHYCNLLTDMRSIYSANGKFNTINFSLEVDDNKNFEYAYLWFNSSSSATGWKRVILHPKKNGDDKYKQHMILDPKTGKYSSEIYTFKGLDSLSGSYFYECKFTNSTGFDSAGVDFAGPSPITVPRTANVSLIKTNSSASIYYPITNSIITGLSLLDMEMSVGVSGTNKGELVFSDTKGSTGSIRIGDKNNFVGGKTPFIVKDRRDRYIRIPVDPHFIDTSSGAEAIFRKDSTEGIIAINEYNEVLHPTETKEEKKFGDFKITRYKQPDLDLTNSTMKFIYAKTLLKIVKDLQDYYIQEVEDLTLNPLAKNNFHTDPIVYDFLIEEGSQYRIHIMKDGKELTAAQQKRIFLDGDKNSEEARLTRENTKRITIENFTAADSGIYWIEFTIVVGPKGAKVDTDIRLKSSETMIFFIPKNRGKLPDLYDKQTNEPVLSGVIDYIETLIFINSGMTAAEFPITVSLRSIDSLSGVNGNFTIFASSESTMKGANFSYNKNITMMNSEEDFKREIAHEVSHAITNYEASLGYGPFYQHGLRFLRNMIKNKMIIGSLDQTKYDLFTNANGDQIEGRSSNHGPISLIEDGHGLDEGIQNTMGTPIDRRYPTSILGQLGSSDPKIADAEKDAIQKMSPLFGDKEQFNLCQLSGCKNTTDSTQSDFKEFRYPLDLYTAADGIPEKIGMIKPSIIKFTLRPSIENNKRTIEYQSITWFINGVARGDSLYYNIPSGIPAFLSSPINASETNIFKVKPDGSKTRLYRKMPKSKAYADAMDPTLGINNVKVGIEKLQGTTTYTHDIILAQPAKGVEYDAKDLHYEFDVTPYTSTGTTELAAYAIIRTNLGLMYTNFIYIRPESEAVLKLKYGPDKKDVVDVRSPSNYHQRVQIASQAGSKKTLRAFGALIWANGKPGYMGMTGKPRGWYYRSIEISSFTGQPWVMTVPAKKEQGSGTEGWLFRGSDVSFNDVATGYRDTQIGSVFKSNVNQDFLMYKVKAIVDSEDTIGTLMIHLKGRVAKKYPSISLSAMLNSTDMAAEPMTVDNIIPKFVLVSEPGPIETKNETIYEVKIPKDSDSSYPPAFDALGDPTELVTWRQLLLSEWWAAGLSYSFNIYQSDISKDPVHMMALDKLIVRAEKTSDRKTTIGVERIATEYRKFILLSKTKPAGTSLKAISPSGVELYAVNGK